MEGSSVQPLPCLQVMILKMAMVIISTGLDVIPR